MLKASFFHSIDKFILDPVDILNRHFKLIILINLWMLNNLQEHIYEEKCE